MHLAIKWQFLYRRCIAPICLKEITYFLKNSSAQIGRRLLPNRDIPPWPKARLGSRAHKLDKKSNFPVGLLGSECSQTHCFFSGALDFYSSWCKWADKGTLGTGLWPSCLLSHCGPVVLPFCHTDSVFFLLLFFLAAHMTGPFGVVSLRSSSREFITSVELCLEGHRKHHTLWNNVITEKQLEWEWLR